MAEEKQEQTDPYYRPKPYGSGVTRRQFLAVAAAGGGGGGGRRGRRAFSA